MSDWCCLVLGEGTARWCEVVSTYVLRLSSSNGIQNDGADADVARVAHGVGDLAKVVRTLVFMWIERRTGVSSPRPNDLSQRRM